MLNKLRSRGFRGASLSTYDCSTLYTILPHNLIKEKRIDLIKRTFQGYAPFTLHVMIETSEEYKKIHIMVMLKVF